MNFREESALRRAGASIALIVAVATITGACKSGGSEGGAKRPTAEPKNVRLITVAEESLSATTTANGTLAADEQATLSFKVPGRITSIAVDLGSFVRQGDPIARLDPTDYETKVREAEASMQQARVRLSLDPKGGSDAVNPEATGTVRQARAVLEEARKNLDRGKQLFSSGVIARAQLDAYESTYRVAEAKYQDALEEVRNRQGILLQRKSELEAARQQLADTVLRAPFNGAISERTATIGEYVNAGAAVGTLVRLNPLRMKAEVPEREARGIQVGQSCVVRSEERAETARGRVARVSPVIDEESRVLVVEIEVENASGALRPGGFARAMITTAASVSTIVVPESAVVAFAGIEKVYTVKDGKAAEKIVTTGRREGGVEITSGLAAGEQIIADPGNIVAGQPVVVE